MNVEGEENVTVTSNRDLVADLSRPDAYPWRPATVELIETHMSWVFVVGERVVKVKRPIVFGFVDHSTVERRRDSCQEELRLNRRLTTNVYLDVAPITREPDGYRLDGGGPICEWATVMRRLPSQRMLDQLLTVGAVPSDLGERLAARLVAFHRDVAANCGHSSFGTAAAIAKVLTENLDELKPFLGTMLAPGQFGLVERAVRDFLSTHRDLLVARTELGWVRDGHGDLRCEHVCLEEDGAIQVFDCVEFNPALRCADVASDLAFLLMDLDRLGAAPLARELIQRYRTNGIDMPDQLLRLYRVHRALVRAKVACLTIANATAPQPSLLGQAVDYLDLATSMALSVRPVLIVMTGLSGTGKSTVAARLARALGLTRIASDVVRKELAGVGGKAAAAWQSGIYAPEWTELAYRELFVRADQLLASGQGVLLDATFLAGEQRAEAAGVAARSGIPFVLVETVCAEDVVIARLAARAERADSPSDATISIYRQQRAAITESPPSVPPGAIAVQVDTTLETPVDLDTVLTALEQAWVIRAAIMYDLPARVAPTACFPSGQVLGRWDSA